MRSYQLCGGIFTSELEFPELGESSYATNPDWLLTRSDGSVPSDADWTVLGTDTVEEGVMATLIRCEASGLARVRFDDTGVFDVSADGRRVTWYAPVDVDEYRARKDVLGRIFAVMLHQQGIVTLHGSAVDLFGEGVAFLAPKFFGKSTTAAFLADEGARLLADDLVIVDKSEAGVSMVNPALSTVNLWSDSALCTGQSGVVVQPGSDGKKVEVRYDVEAHGEGVAGAVPLSAIYLLAPNADPTAPVSRELLPKRSASIALIGHLKLGELLGGITAMQLLPTLEGLLDTTSVYVLKVPRDLERLPELGKSLFGWHNVTSQWTS